MSFFSVAVRGHFVDDVDPALAAQLQDRLTAYSTTAALVRDLALNEFEVLITTVAADTDIEAGQKGRAIAASALFDCGFSIRSAPLEDIVNVSPIAG